jgi:predicted nucleic acid-binding protein
MANEPLIAWDTMVLINAIEGEGAPLGPKGENYWADIEPMYTDAENGKVRILVSEIVIAEASTVRAVRDGKVTTDEAERMIREFLNNRFIMRRPADRRESILAADLVRKHRLETCDALIVATALIHDAAVLVSRDGKRRRNSQPSPLKLNGMLSMPGKNPLRIVEPNAAEWLKAPLYATQKNDE